MKYVHEKDAVTLTETENQKIVETLEAWRTLLSTENMAEIRKIQQFIIPTKNLKFFPKINFRISDNVMIDFKTFDEEDTFDFAFTFVQVPYFIFITTVWGKTNTIKQYQLGKKVKPRISELPKNITDLLYDLHYTKYFESYNQISEKQRKIIENRVKRKTSKQS